MVKDSFGTADCSTCGRVDINDLSKVTLIYTMDMIEYLIRYRCDCKRVVTENISRPEADFLLESGVDQISFNTSLTPLTDEDIYKWNIDEELSELYKGI